MGDHELCKQYVLSDFGDIFYGNQHQISARPWNYGQVRVTIMMMMMIMMRRDVHVLGMQ